MSVGGLRISNIQHLERRGEEESYSERVTYNTRFPWKKEEEEKHEKQLPERRERKKDPEFSLMGGRRIHLLVERVNEGY